MAASLRRVLRSEDLPAGTENRPEIRRARFGASEVLLARLAGGDVVAFHTRCPHQDTSLEEATLWDGNLRCPRHLYLYDPRTGENVLPARDAREGTLWKLKPGYLPVYRTEERDGWIWVADAPEPPPPSYDAENERRRAAEPEPETSPPSGQPQPLDHPTESIQVTVEEEFEVVLPTVPRPGHLWRVEVSDELVAVTSQRMDLEGDPCYRVGLRARGPGAAALRCTYARPWDTTPAEVRSFVVSIEGGLAIDQ